MTWAIYLADWRTALRKGDPLLAIVEAETKSEAEQRAAAAGVSYARWGGTALFAVPHRGPRECGVLEIGARE